MSTGIKIVYGGATFSASRTPAFNDHDVRESYVKVLKDGGVQNIDTAQLYPGSEETLGMANAASSFIIDTKTPGGFSPGSSTKENVLQKAEQSLKTLKTDQVDIFYIHAPDRKVPIAETLSAIDELHKAGKFKRFGLSNFTVEEVEEVIRVCRENNYVAPSVYQGNYSPIARLYEKTLFPLLREHKMAFYAYSPLAGGFLTKTRQQIAEHAGRFNPAHPVGRQYLELYNKPLMLDALDKWDKIADDAGIPRAELAYRWVRYNSILKPEYGDAIIFGATTMEQLVQTIDALQKGPLSEDVVERIDEVWKHVEEEAPLDNFNSTFMGAA